MRDVSYKTSWAYAGSGVKHKAPLVDFILDILYLMDNSGVIPPLHILNEVLKRGTTGGGMGPGTTWRPFSIKEDEYNELVAALLNLDIIEAKKTHRYVMFHKAIVDDTLAQYSTYPAWLSAVAAKYRKSG